MSSLPKLLGPLLAPYGLMLRLPLGDQPRLDPPAQLRYVDVALALPHTADPGERFHLLLEKTELESRAGRFDDAMRCLAVAAALAEALGPEARAEALYHRGKHRAYSARYEEAAQDFARVIASLPAEDLIARRAQLQLGRVYLHGGRFAEAAVHLGRGLEGGGHTRLNLLGGLYDRVYALINDSRLDEAEATLAAAERAADPGDGQDRARIAYYRGWIAVTRRRLPEAIALLEHASREFAVYEDHDAHACAELALARIELASSQLVSSVDRCDRARRMGTLKPEIAICLSLLRGLALFGSGRFDEASADYRRAERQAEAAGRVDLRCRALEWHAELDTFGDECDRALEALEVARGLRHGVGDALGEAIALSIMGNAHRSAGRPARALDCYREARAIAERIGNRIELARIAAEQMVLEMLRGDLQSAERHGQEALAIYEALDKRVRRAIVVAQLGAIAALRDDFDRSERLFEEAIALLGDAPDRIILTEILQARADALADRGALDEALGDLGRAQTLAESAGSRYLAAATRAQAEELRQRHAAQSLLSRYIEPKIASRLLARGPRRLAENIQQEATILFSDIRGYTTLTEQLGAHEVVGLLNEHFTAMTEEIVALGGTIDKFIGDAVMAVFGDPGKPAPDDALRAVRAAIAMVKVREALNQERARRQLEPIEIGVGIDSGSVVMGNIGSPRRLTFTVVGDTVNVAARLESLTKTMGYSILISDATRARLGGSIRTRSLGEVEVKGRTGRVAVFAVVY